MKVSNIVQRATEFGTFRSEHNIFSFTLKILFYLIPAVVLGNYTDVLVKKLQKDRALGDNILYYILLQTFIIVSTLYILIVFLSDYESEFQVTITGAYFTALYFSIQTNYIQMFQEFMSPR